MFVPAGKVDKPDGIYAAQTWWTANGLDAVDGAFATIYGEANLTHFQVWAYQVNPQQVSVGDPVDLSKRLDGDTTVRLS